MADIKSLAVAKWRLQKWLEHTDVPKKLPAESSLRAIEEYLNENDVTILDLSGQEYDSGLAVDVAFCENEKDRSRKKPCIITEMLSPVIMINGEVAKRGQVVISKPAPKKSSVSRKQSVAKKSKDSK